MERDRIVAMAAEKGVKNEEKIRRRMELQAAVQMGNDLKVNKDVATAAGIKMTPLIITTAGTMHKVVYKALKKFFLDGNQRRWVLKDIAIFLARSRGSVYARLWKWRGGQQQGWRLMRMYKFLC